MLYDPEFWVAVAFVIFVVGLGYVGVFKTLGASLDQRAARIKTELEDAAKLKNEAMALVAEYRRKRDAAEGEAQSIIAGAKADADRLAIEAKAKAEEFVARRTKLAETKIAQAESQAIADVRNAAAEAAVAAAERLLAQQATGQVAMDLIAKGIADVRTKLN